jgi:hypothetical protein
VRERERDGELESGTAMAGWYYLFYREGQGADSSGEGELDGEWATWPGSVPGKIRGSRASGGRVVGAERP